MKKFIPVFIAALTMITVMISTLLSRKSEKCWAEMNKKEKQMRIVTVASGVVLLTSGIIAFLLLA
ncbi:MAG: hypothetical protein JXA62_07350 [Candidatus Aminicenantes bacterium]|nr:hypothetical protein [Candidatus Aminicenantes bacterium]